MSAFDTALKKYKKTIVDRETLEGRAKTIRMKMEEVQESEKRKKQEKMLLNAEEKKAAATETPEPSATTEPPAPSATTEPPAPSATTEPPAPSATTETPVQNAAPLITPEGQATPDEIEHKVDEIEEKAADAAATLFQDAAEVAAATEPKDESITDSIKAGANKLSEAAEHAAEAVDAVEGTLEKGREIIATLPPEVQATASAASDAASAALSQAKELGSALEVDINKAGPAITALTGQVNTALIQIDGQLDSLKGMDSENITSSTQAAADSISGATVALKVAGTTIMDGIKAIPTDQIKGQGAAAMAVVSAQGKKAIEAAEKIVSLAQQSAPEIAAKAKAVGKKIQEALTKAISIKESDTAVVAAEISSTLTESASTLSSATREIATFISTLEPAAAEQLKNKVADIASSAVDVAQAAAGAVQGITSKLGPILHTAAAALGVTALTALAASPALPVVVAVASIVMMIMHQKKMHSALVSKMKSYFNTLMQMLEIFKVMSVIGSRMAYAVDDGDCIQALNAFKAYLYLIAPPSLREAFEQAGENKNNTGKTMKLSWFQKTTGKIQRIFASNSIMEKLDGLFADIITPFLLTMSKFNIVTSIHSDILLSMKADIVKLDEVVKFFNRIRVEPIKKCEGEEDCRTDEEIQKEAAHDSELLDQAKERLKISDEAVQKNITKTGAVIAKIEASPMFQKEKKEIQEDITKAVDKVDPAHVTGVAGPGEPPKKRGWLWGGRSQGGRSQGGRSQGGRSQGGGSRNRKAVPAKRTKKLKRS